MEKDKRKKKNEKMSLGISLFNIIFFLIEIIIHEFVFDIEIGFIELCIIVFVNIGITVAAFVLGMIVEKDKWSKGGMILAVTEILLLILLIIYEFWALFSEPTPWDPMC